MRSIIPGIAKTNPKHAAWAISFEVGGHVHRTNLTIEQIKTIRGSPMPVGKRIRNKHLKRQRKQEERLILNLKDGVNFKRWGTPILLEE